MLTATEKSTMDAAQQLPSVSGQHPAMRVARMADSRANQGVGIAAADLAP